LFVACAVGARHLQVPALSYSNVGIFLHAPLLTQGTLEAVNKPRQQ
jgi:hypothetical protein